MKLMALAVFSVSVGALFSDQAPCAAEELGGQEVVLAAAPDGPLVRDRHTTLLGESDAADHSDADYAAHLSTGSRFSVRPFRRVNLAAAWG